MNSDFELIAFEVSDVTGWDLLPACRRRSWMDATPDGFANRCLPMSMANHAGWVITSPTTFTATWDGGEAPEGLVLSFAEPTLPCVRSITSHFGSGMVTLNLPYLFRTPPGVGPLSRGLPNSGKAHCFPLEGYVETDWASATFTMNWKLITPEVSVTFHVGEPICFLQLIDISLIERAQPSIRPATSCPKTFKEYRHWQEGRTAFNADADRGTTWQKDYYLGRQTVMQREVRHRTALRIGKFERK